MDLPARFLVLVSFLAIAHDVQAAWPDGPFSSSGRWIVNTNAEPVTYAGVNWPGAGETMIPEGLQFQSIATLVAKIKSIGMNVIRLTYAIEMIDDVFDNGMDVTVENSMIKALGATNGSKVFNQIVTKNPQFDYTTTRLQVFDAVAAECFRQQIYVHLDNHISKAEWCCATNDGNGWFGDQYFNVANWQRGLKYMAMRGAGWGNMMSMGLRNELRNSGLPTYGWPTWYINMVAAANAVYSVNPGTLIFFSGLNFDTTLAPITTASPLGDGLVFHKTDFTFQNKIVLELHSYASAGQTCTSLETWLIDVGFNALGDNVANQLPVLMTEWGHAQDSTTYLGTYSTCLGAFLPQHKAGWMVWSLAGSYYIRSGVQDFDDTWGLLNHDWSEWQSAVSIEYGLQPIITASLAVSTEEVALVPQQSTMGLGDLLRRKFAM